MTAPDNEIYAVVRNIYGQYSIWPKRDKLPAGWENTNYEGARQACLAHIDEIWTDITPKIPAMKV